MMRKTEANRLLVSRQQIERLPHPDIGLEWHETLHRFGLAVRDRVTRGRPDRSPGGLGRVGDKASRGA